MPYINKGKRRAIRKAKAEGVDISCETGPHYLVFNDMDIKDEGRFKMNLH